MSPSVVVLDYGSGNVRSVVRALEHVGAQVELTADTAPAADAHGLLVPGVGNFHACMAGLRAARAEDLVRGRVRRQAPVMGICVGLQVFYEGSDEHSAAAEPGMGLWPGRVQRLRAEIVPHMGWSTVRPGAGSRLLEGLAEERFYFVHSYAVPAPRQTIDDHVVSTAEHGDPFVAAVEDGPLTATQFHPEKSGDAGLHLMRNWVRSL